MISHSNATGVTDPCSHTSPHLASGTTYTSNQADKSIPQTTQRFTCWSDKNPPNFNATVFGEGPPGDASFKAEWANSGDFLARAGLYWNEGKYYWDYTNVFAEYSYTRINCMRSTDPSKCADSGVAGDYSYIGVYGWSQNPLVEFYIVDDWFGNQWTSDDVNVQEGSICYQLMQEGGTCKVGDITVGGVEYTVYKNSRFMQPSIEGITNFTQYFSMRNIPQRCGTIPVSEHFKKWEELGLHLGTMFEAKLLVEVGGGTGWINYMYANVVDKQPDVCAPLSDDHYEVDPTNTAVCRLRQCADRRRSHDPVSPCGGIGCYWDVDNKVNTMLCIGEEGTCTNPNHRSKDFVTQTCALKTCEDRIPLDGTEEWSCGPPSEATEGIGCFLDLNATGCTTTCFGGTFGDNGRCVILPCHHRTPELDEDFPCMYEKESVLCYLDFPTGCRSSCSNPHYIENTTMGRCDIIGVCADRIPVVHSLPVDDESPPDYIRRMDVYIQAVSYTFNTDYKCNLWVEYGIDGVVKHSTINNGGCTNSHPWIVDYPDTEPVLVWNNVPENKLEVQVMPIWEAQSARYNVSGPFVSIVDTKRISADLDSDYTLITTDRKSVV